MSMCPWVTVEAEISEPKSCKGKKVRVTRATSKEAREDAFKLVKGYVLENSKRAKKVRYYEDSWVGDNKLGTVTEVRESAIR